MVWVVRLAAVFALIGGSGVEAQLQPRGAEQAEQATPSVADLQVYGLADYDWTLQALDGEAQSLSDWEGRVLFINLWASWCTPCIREMETIERLRDRLSDTEVEFLIVAAEGERAVRRHLRRYPSELPIYLEIDRIPAAFGLRGLPTTWVVDRAGRIVLLRHGEAVWDTDEVETFLRSLPGATPRPDPSPQR